MKNTVLSGFALAGLFAGFTSSCDDRANNKPVQTKLEERVDDPVGKAVRHVSDRSGFFVQQLDFSEREYAEENVPFRGYNSGKYITVKVKDNANGLHKDSVVRWFTKEGTAIGETRENIEEGKKTVYSTEFKTRGNHDSKYIVREDGSLNVLWREYPDGADRIRNYNKTFPVYKVNDKEVKPDKEYLLVGKQRISYLEDRRNGDFFLVETERRDSKGNVLVQYGKIYHQPVSGFNSEACSIPVYREDGKFKFDERAIINAIK